MKIESKSILAPEDVSGIIIKMSAQDVYSDEYVVGDKNGAGNSYIADDDAEKVVFEPLFDPFVAFPPLSQVLAMKSSLLSSKINVEQQQQPAYEAPTMSLPPPSKKFTTVSDRSHSVGTPQGGGPSTSHDHPPPPPPHDDHHHPPPPPPHDDHHHPPPPNQPGVSAEPITELNPLILKADLDFVSTPLTTKYTASSIAALNMVQQECAVDYMKNCLFPDFATTSVTSASMSASPQEEGWMNFVLPDFMMNTAKDDDDSGGGNSVTGYVTHFDLILNRMRRLSTASDTASTTSTTAVSRSPLLSLKHQFHKVMDAKNLILNNAAATVATTITATDTTATATESVVTGSKPAVVSERPRNKNNSKNKLERKSNNKLSTQVLSKQDLQENSDHHHHHHRNLRGIKDPIASSNTNNGNGITLTHAMMKEMTTALGAALATEDEYVPEGEPVPAGLLKPPQSSSLVQSQQHGREMSVSSVIMKNNDRNSNNKMMMKQLHNDQQPPSDLPQPPIDVPDHHHHHHPPPHPPLSVDTTYTGSLGYGTAGDQCMLEHYNVGYIYLYFDPSAPSRRLSLKQINKHAADPSQPAVELASLSSGCQQAISDVYTLRAEYFNEYAMAADPHHPPLPSLILPVFLLLMVIAVFARRMYRHPYRKYRRQQINNVLSVLEANPQLKAAIEAETGTPLPKKLFMEGKAGRNVNNRHVHGGGFWNKVLRVIGVLFLTFVVAMTSVVLTANIVMGHYDVTGEITSPPVAGGMYLVVLLFELAGVYLVYKGVRFVVNRDVNGGSGSNGRTNQSSISSTSSSSLQQQQSRDEYGNDGGGSNENSSAHVFGQRIRYAYNDIVTRITGSTSGDQAQSALYTPLTSDMDSSRENGMNGGEIVCAPSAPTVITRHVYHQPATVHNPMNTTITQPQQQPVVYYMPRVAAAHPVSGVNMM